MACSSLMPSAMHIVGALFGISEEMDECSTHSTVGAVSSGQIDGIYIKQKPLWAI